MLNKEIFKFSKDKVQFGGFCIIPYKVGCIYN